MVELVYTYDLGSYALRLVGSNPTTCTRDYRERRTMNSKGHFLMSISKSVIRILSCILSLKKHSILPLAVGLLGAEVLGIAEELVDKR